MTIELTKPIAPGLSVASGCAPSDCVAMASSRPGPVGPCGCSFPVEWAAGAGLDRNRCGIAPGLISRFGIILSLNRPICASGSVFQSILRRKGASMRVLLVGAGGVGGSIAVIAARRDFFELMVVADFDAARAAQVAGSTGDPRFVPAQVDASDSP